jgi:hypothetical protein
VLWHFEQPQHWATSASLAHRCVGTKEMLRLPLLKALVSPGAAAALSNRGLCFRAAADSLREKRSAEASSLAASIRCLRWGSSSEASESSSASDAVVPAERPYCGLVVLKCSSMRFSVSVLFRLAAQVMTWSAGPPYQNLQ